MKFTTVFIVIAMAMFFFATTIEAKKGDTIIIAGHKEHGCHCPMYVPVHHGHMDHGYGGFRK